MRYLPNHVVRIRYSVGLYLACSRIKRPPLYVVRLSTLRFGLRITGAPLKKKKRKNKNPTILCSSWNWALNSLASSCTRRSQNEMDGYVFFVEVKKCCLHVFSRWYEYATCPSNRFIGQIALASNTSEFLTSVALKKTQSIFSFPFSEWW